MGNNRTKLFLLELIFIILFFAFAGAVCINMFANAKILSEKSTDLTMASLTAQSCAEVFKASKTQETFLKTLDADVEGQMITLYYDTEWQKTDAANSTYRVEIHLSANGGLTTARISVVKKDVVIYDMITKRLT